MKNFKAISTAVLAISLVALLALASGCNKPTAAQANTSSKAAMNANVDSQKATAGEAGKASDCSSCEGCMGKDKAAADATAAGDEKPVAENAAAGEAKGECAGCADCKESGSCGGDCEGKGCENAQKKAGECSGGCEGCPGKDAKAEGDTTEEEKKAVENSSTV